MTFPSAVVTIRDYLDSKALEVGDPVRAFGGVPDPRPTRFIRLQQSGSRHWSPAHRDVQVVVECHDTSEYEAERLSDLVAGWLAAMDTPNGYVPESGDGWLGGPYTQPDPDSGTPRYVQTVVLRQRSK